MGLEVRKPEGQDFVVVEEKMWLTADDRLVPDGHRDALTLFATPGKRVDLATAVRYGLVDEPKAKVKKVDAPENKAVEAPDEDKAVEAPDADKDAEPEPVEAPEPAPEPEPEVPAEPVKKAAKRTRKKAAKRTRKKAT